MCVPLSVPPQKKVKCHFHPLCWYRNNKSPDIALRILNSVKFAKRHFAPPQQISAYAPALIEKVELTGYLL